MGQARLEPHPAKRPPQQSAVVELHMRSGPQRRRQGARSPTMRELMLHWARHKLFADAAFEHGIGRAVVGENSASFGAAYFRRYLCKVLAQAKQSFHLGGKQYLLSAERVAKRGLHHLYKGVELYLSYRVAGAFTREVGQVQGTSSWGANGSAVRSEPTVATSYG
ncbi:hypothetical protein ACLOJK_010919 [Asimina triloba]